MSFFSNAGNLSDYLMRNSSLLQSYPTELGNIMNYVINGMVYLHECRVVHGELVSTKGCLRLVFKDGIITVLRLLRLKIPLCKKASNVFYYYNFVLSSTYFIKTI